MTEILCTGCGKNHRSNSRYCEFCGKDLEDVILRYKEQHLPIKLNNNSTKEIKNEQRKSYGCFGLFHLFCCHGDCPSKEVQEERKRVLKEKKWLRNCLITFLIISFIIMVACILFLVLIPV